MSTPAYNPREELKRLLQGFNEPDYAKAVVDLKPRSYCVFTIDPVDFGWEDLETVGAYLARSTDKYGTVALLNAFVATLREDYSETYGGEPTDGICLFWLLYAATGSGSFQPCVVWKIDSDGITFVAAETEMLGSLKNLCSTEYPLKEYFVFDLSFNFSLREICS